MDKVKIDEQLIPKYDKLGKEKFYNALILSSVEKIIAITNKTHIGVSPEIEMLEISKKLISLYRKSGNSKYLEISSVFRKASHKIYRLMLNKGLIVKNGKFLNLV